MRWSMKRDAARPAFVPSAASFRLRSDETKRLVRGVERQHRDLLRNPAANTFAAASGSAQMLNSAEGVMLPL